MKSPLQLLALGLVVASASAIPLVSERQEVVYALTVTTDAHDSLNGQTLEIVNSVVGVYSGEQPPAEVYSIANSTNPDLVSLHTWPIGIVDHVLALKGNSGLYSLVDSLNIRTSIEGLHYDTFKLENGFVTQTQDIPGGWVAFPSENGWVVKWYDGTAPVILNYVRVKIAYKAIKV